MGLLAKIVKAGRTLNKGDVRWIRALFVGVAPSMEHIQILQALSPKLVVDIGANRGQFSLVARHCFPGVPIRSFEPLHEPAELFRKVFASDELTLLYESAIGPESGSTKIHVSESDDSSSLLPISEKQNLLFPGTAESGTRSVRVSHLSEFLSSENIVDPALLKLDVQGFELSALTGCEDLIDRFVWIYVECSFVELYEGQALADEIIEWLREHGFMLIGVYNVSYDRKGIAIQADFLFKVIEQRKIIT